MVINQDLLIGRASKQTSWNFCQLSRDPESRFLPPRAKMRAAQIRKAARPKPFSKQALVHLQIGPLVHAAMGAGRTYI